MHHLHKNVISVKNLSQGLSKWKHLVKPVIVHIRYHHLQGTVYTLSPFSPFNFYTYGAKLLNTGWDSGHFFFIQEGTFGNQKGMIN